MHLVQNIHEKVVKTVLLCAQQVCNCMSYFLQAVYLKAAMLPVAGALVGGVVGLAVGGPIGLVVGSKLAFAAIATGSVVAGAGVGVAAKEIKKHSTQQHDKDD